MIVEKSYILPMTFINFTGPLISETAQRPHQKYIRDWSSTKVESDISSVPSLIFQAVKKCIIWPQFSTPIDFESASFSNRVT